MSTAEVRRMTFPKRGRRMDALLTAEDLADFCRVSTKTVYAWNTTGEGPKYHRVGKYVRYRRSDVDKWLEKRAVQPNG
ncbi:helix-turn-helix transcriptional regulator [Amycolatopsis sp. NPDC059657]|uniref:helix-turn-helix transcriptional regulator n=1 Tax=Amycolatopsis sp. NPDC059657 TaxID=3346899 RepID=UPI00366CD873